MTDLKTEFHPDWKCFIAHTGGDNPVDSRWIGEGSTPEDARSDYWSLAHKGQPTARLIREDGQWQLYDGIRAFLFENKEAAIEHADKNQWLCKW
jgi:hypothetical protein